MSYLDSLRLHFAGRFQAAPSTVNNDVAHFDNATFQASYQQMQTDTAANGWWNPGGGAEWRFLGCTVTSAWYVPSAQAGAVLVGDDDAVLGCHVADSDRRAPAKIVDLDPLQQLVSVIWGLEVRLCTPDGRQLLRGQFDPVGFVDIWTRVQGGGGGDGAASSVYQSVLTDLEWASEAELAHSPFLRALQQATSDGLLSIKFNVDAYVTDFTSPDFTTGRITGTIGPYTAGEPRYFVPGRQFVPVRSAQNLNSFYVPLAGIGFCVARLDEQARRVFLDLGNALPTASPGSPFVDQGALQLVLPASDPLGTNQPIGDPIDYLSGDWYPTTAGVAMLPLDQDLTDAEMAAIKITQLALQLTPPTPPNQPPPPLQLTYETPNGLYVRADQFVFRADAGQAVAVRLLATRYGQPYPEATILLAQDASQLQPGPAGTPPTPGLPTEALTLPNQNAVSGQGQVTTGADGWVTMTIALGDPEHNRIYIDGQVYGVRPTLAEIPFTTPPTDPNQPQQFPLGQWNYVSFLLWDRFEPDQPVTWYGSLQPIFQQYANLYPVMSRFLNLADPLAVWKYRELLHMAFSLPITDSNTMPVTRDLSTPKRAAILKWLAADLMLLGEPAQAEAPDALLSQTIAPLVAAAATPAKPKAGQGGGKASAIARRLGAARA